MSRVGILTEGFARAAARAVESARKEALAAGHPVVFIDKAGRYVEEMPDGRRYEIRLDAGRPRETHRVVLRELTAKAG